METEKEKEKDFMDMMLAQIREGLPEAEYSHMDVLECRIELEDGVNLRTTVYSPDRNQKWPVVLIRNPYIGNEILATTVLSRFFSSYGYALVYVRVRGTLGSEGEWLPFEHERQDGRQVIDWISEQKWCDGNIGTFGDSYLGHTQWCVADYHHPMLKTMFISFYGTNSYETFYRRGMFRQEVWTEWAAQMMEENKEKILVPEVAVPLREKAFSVKPQSKLGERLVGKECTWYKGWLENEKETDAYWSRGFWKELRDVPEKVEIPVFLRGGWFDIFLRPQLVSWRMLPEHIRKQSRFMIGPWHHSGMTGGSLAYPDEGKAGMLALKAALEWFDYQLKGREYQEPLGCIDAYVIGENRWRVWKGNMNQTEGEIFYLDCSQTAADQPKAKCLRRDCPKEYGTVEYRYDPQKPVESQGGNLIANHHNGSEAPECSCFQPEAGYRDDVVSFLSDEFTREYLIAGKIELHLYVSSDVPATAFSVKVMEEYADGKTVNIRDDITDIRWRDEQSTEKYCPGECVELVLEMLDICWLVKKGSKLRIDISSSNYPAYHVHPNTEEPWYDAMESATALQKIYSGGVYPSRMILPHGRESGRTQDGRC